MTDNLEVKKMGGQWFLHDEGKNIEPVTHEWVKIHYPNLVKTDAIHQIIDYVNRKIKTQHITPGVGKTLLARLKEILK